MFLNYEALLNQNVRLIVSQYQAHCLANIQRVQQLGCVANANFFVRSYLLPSVGLDHFIVYDKEIDLCVFQYFCNSGNE